MMKAVIDTNVLVSGLIRAQGPPGRIVDLMRAGLFQPVVDDRILAEYEEVLSRPELARYFSIEDRESVLEFLRNDSYYALASTVVDDLPDPSDTPFLEIAVCTDAVLVTGNTGHFPPDRRRGATVLSPREFLTRFFSG